MRIEFRIKPELKQKFATYCEVNGQTITETLIKYIEGCTHNKKDIVHTVNDIVRTKEVKPTKNVRTGIENVRTNKGSVRTDKVVESDKAHPLDAKAITLFKKPYNELNFNQKLRIKA